MKKGLIHLYTGDGKGKTTASVGLSVRASGGGLRVVFAQFMKGLDSSEIHALGTLGVQIIHPSVSTKFVFQMDDNEKTEHSIMQDETLDEAIVTSTDTDLLVLDEVISAVTTGMIALEKLISFLKNKPETLEVVLTGRDAPQALKDIADYLTNMQAVKHPYENGISSRKGIEF